MFIYLLLYREDKRRSSSSHQINNENGRAEFVKENIDKIQADKEATKRLSQQGRKKERVIIKKKGVCEDKTHERKRKNRMRDEWKS